MMIIIKQLLITNHNIKMIISKMIINKSKGYEERKKE